MFFTKNEPAPTNSAYANKTGLQLGTELFDELVAKAVEINDTPEKRFSGWLGVLIAEHGTRTPWMMALAAAMTNEAERRKQSKLGNRSCTNERNSL